MLRRGQLQAGPGAGVSSPLNPPETFAGDIMLRTSMRRVGCSLALCALVLASLPAAQASGGGEAAPAGPAPLPFVVNVGKTGHGGTVLQTTIVLSAANPQANQAIETYKPLIQHEIIQIISSESPEQLGTQAGKTALANKIVETVNKVLHLTRKNGVKDVFFTSFILQQP